LLGIVYLLGKRLRVWDVSKSNKTSEIVGTLDADNSVYNFTTTSDSLKTFVAFDGSNFNVPIGVGRIKQPELTWHGVCR
jgi:hypothetical protein